MKNKKSFFALLFLGAVIAFALSRLLIGSDKPPEHRKFEKVRSFDHSNKDHNNDQN